MLLKNVYIFKQGGNASQIEIKDTRITAVVSTNENKIESPDQSVINFSDAVAFPGLINSHDHLEFNLYPQLGNRFYNDYVEWGNDIHDKNNDQIEKIKRIPYELRFRWGLYKNLLCGITTVVNHGTGEIYYYNRLPEVFTNYNYIHSIRLEKNWKLRLNIVSNGKPFVIHVGEGVNKNSIDEIDKLLQWNIFHKKIIGVHGISMNSNQSENFQSLIWCPNSNLFLYNRTADIPALKKKTKILFGTDSTLSADWNFWNHIRLAKKMNYLNDEELYNSITTNAAEIWKMNLIGSILPGKTADILIIKKKIKNDWESFYDTNPEDILLIIKHGAIVFIDAGLAEEQSVINLQDFDLISIKTIRKYVTKGIIELMETIKGFIPEYEFPFSIG
jgi:cytosine/adenosine deaminase-related metal-dependent hydrolase